MKDHILTKKLKGISTIWIVTMCIALILRYPIRFYCGIVASLFIWGISLMLAILDFVKKRHVFLGILCLLLSIVLTIIAPIFSMPIVIRNPYTPQLFASEIDTNFLLKGTVTYYRKWGPILYSPQKSNTTEIASGDSNYVYIDKDHVYVNSTFYGFGADYEIGNDAIDLRGERVETWHIRHKNFSWCESFTLSDESPYVLFYSNSDGVENRVTLNDADYKNLIGILQKMPLANQPTTPYENTFYYLLTVGIKNDDSGYNAVVDGEEAFSMMKSYFE